MLMVAGSTGLAPPGADHDSQPPRIRAHSTFEHAMPANFYDPPTLWQIAAHNPWLSVSPVSEYNGDPLGPPTILMRRRCAVRTRQTGRLPDVVSPIRRLGRSADSWILRWTALVQPPRPCPDHQARHRSAFSTTHRAEAGRKSNRPVASPDMAYGLATRSPLASMSD